MNFTCNMCPMVIRLQLHPYLPGAKEINTLRPRQNGRHFADDIFKCIFQIENIWISFKISLKFVPKGPINNIPALVQLMAWRLPGDKPLSELMMASLLTHICVTRPQWVNWQTMNTYWRQVKMLANTSNMHSFPALHDHTNVACETLCPQPCQSHRLEPLRAVAHDDVIKWKHFPRYWPFGGGNMQLSVSLLCTLVIKVLGMNLAKLHSIHLASL